MTDNKLTDKEIVKVLECCSTCKQVLIDAKDLINRLQAKVERYKKSRDDYQDKVMFIAKQCDELQAENERLSKEVDRLSQVVLYNDSVTEMKVEETKAEAYKNFAERLKDKAYTYSDITGYQSTVVDVNEINGVYEELVGDNNG